jgi:MFS family permease
VVRPAAVLALALLGDALLYVVLPLHATDFGVTLAWVGVLLSANRLIRILAYGGIARLGGLIGARRLTLAAAVGAVASTAAYGLAASGPLLLGARVLWGLAFGALNLTTLAYALGDPARAGRRVGWSRAVIALGPVLALTAGAWLVGPVGPRGVFLVLAAVTAGALPLAWALEDLDPPPSAGAPGPGRGRFRPSWLDGWAFAVGLGVDGVFVVTLSLLLAGVVSTSSAVLGGGLLLALRYVVEVLVSPAGGALSDRAGPGRILLASGLVLAGGLGAVAGGWVWPGAVAVVLARGALITAGPVLAAERRPRDHLGALAAFNTWRDAGAAVGPLTAGLLAESLGLRVLHGAVALGLLLVLCWDLPRLASRR